MSDTKMLQAILNGQAAIKEELKGEIRKVRVDLTEMIKEVSNKVDENTDRLDKLGLQIANLEDDAPTIEEFDKLEKRVTKLEQQVPEVN